MRSIILQEEEFIPQRLGGEMTSENQGRSQSRKDIERRVDFESSPDPKAPATNGTGRLIFGEKETGDQEAAQNKK